jgi:hypothetical protein
MKRNDLVPFTRKERLVLKEELGKLISWHRKRMESIHREESTAREAIDREFFRESEEEERRMAEFAEWMAGIDERIARRQARAEEERRSLEAQIEGLLLGREPEAGIPPRIPEETRKRSTETNDEGGE